ncbi:hypothetical protein HZ326_25487 [Fusarium oxysporum f. sp. albedinis]|nr:hypothetical protein HZ326_25487 [Fusarium oxysporum f. sp. albedinis]
MTISPSTRVGNQSFSATAQKQPLKPHRPTSNLKVPRPSSAWNSPTLRSPSSSLSTVLRLCEAWVHTS